MRQRHVTYSFKNTSIDVNVRLIHGYPSSRVIKFAKLQ